MFCINPSKLTAQNNLNLFASLTDEEQNMMFYLVCKNHLRPYKNDEQYQKYFMFLKNIFENINNRKKIFQEVQRIVDGFVLKQASDLKIEDIHQIILQKNKSSKNPFEVSLMINAELFIQGSCPLLFYAFNRWLFIPDIDLEYTEKLLELSFSGLYRALPYHLDYCPSAILFNENGGVFDIFYSHEKQIIYKLPKNIAAINFLAAQEFCAYEYFMKTPLKEFLIPDVMFVENTGVIQHLYIEGKTGEDFLFNDMILSEKQIKSLEKFCLLYKALNSPLKLDIHPGNFVWSEPDGKWYFIDTGTIPQIGSEYYNFSTFKEYFINIWQKRKENMKNIPIRSLDYCIDLNII